MFSCQNILLPLPLRSKIYEKLMHTRPTYLIFDLPYLIFILILLQLMKSKRKVLFVFRLCKSIWHSKQWSTEVIWETGVLIWTPKLWHPKKTSQVFFFHLYCKKICWSSYQWFYNASDYFKNSDKSQKQWDKKTSKQNKKLSTKCFR